MHEAAVVDIFCGIGGLTHGFVKEGFGVVAGIDTDATCKYAFEANNGARFIEKDVADLTAEEVLALYPEDSVKILVGCAPCQPFSRYTRDKANATKWDLVATFAELITDVSPDVVSMENVPELARHPVFEDFQSTLESAGYECWWKVVACADYGVPQSRSRLVFLASKLGPVALLPKTHRPSRRRTVKKAIGTLRPIEAGGADERDPIHKASALSDINLRRIRSTPPGGGWRDWPDDLVLTCHRADTGKSYPSVYGRMVWDDVGPTITTQCNGLGNGRFGHPEQDRAISLREAALLQTFPRYYKLLKPRDELQVRRLGRHIGNAVPVRLGRIIARSIARHLEAHRCDSVVH